MSMDSPRPLAGARGDRPLVIVGGLAARHYEHVRQFALRLGAPIYAEALSGLREDRELDPLLVRNERMLPSGGFDSVIRIGNVPALRLWRDLDESLRGIPVTHYSDLPFPGLPRGEVHRMDELPLPEPRKRDEQFFARDRSQATALECILDEEPRSELAMIRALSREIPRGARIYLGNSLPIREWDLVATREARGFILEGNRGANGIDGQISTFFGWCTPRAENWCIIGDLTALYDGNAPWVVPQLDAKFKIAIINNGGGRIFSRVPSLRRMDSAVRERLIENAHALRFDAWAKMWGIESTLVELTPDAAASRRVWERYDALWV
jgi:2-succinyl-5-enolpyruvyl-6-hydroxy-3-cyclohexene-1-carboxylate synthase